MENKIRVLVLLSTYNGEKYLLEQLNSIFCQKGVDVSLLIRDDGSTDSTVEILNNIARVKSNVEILTEKNVGFVRSFSNLILYVTNSLKYSSFNYFAFADQDDIWLCNKLEKTISEIKSLNQSKPNLCACNSMLVDKNGVFFGIYLKSILSLNPDRISFSKGKLLCSGVFQGCSLTFNRTALELYAKHLPQNSWHDRWLILICSFFGNIRVIGEPLFKYRIHGDNTLGDSIGKDHFWNKVLKFFSNPSRENHIAMAIEFQNVFFSELSKEDHILINVYKNYPHSFMAKIKFFLSGKYTNSISCIIKNLI
mgnify:CR=1 FL=1